MSVYVFVTLFVCVSGRLFIWVIVCAFCVCEYVCV